MHVTRRPIAAALAVACAVGPLASPARADSASELTRNGLRALRQLEDSAPRSHFYARHARAVLVFPSVLKAGFVFGGETGNGVLLMNGKPAGYYNLSGGSWGLQIGGQDFSYALFFMTDSALGYLRKSDGWSVGTGPSIAVINKGAGAEANSTTVT